MGWGWWCAELGLMVGCGGWILTMVTAGLNEWRVWYVSDVTVVTSGLAWVGIWKACFYSHALPTLEVCRSMGVSEGFVPLEISMGQVLVMLAVAVGLAGNVENRGQPLDIWGHLGFPPRQIGRASCRERVSSPV